MKRSRINPISAKKREAMRDEVKVRQACCSRAGGVWLSTEGIYGGVCVGGKCEECGKPPRGRMLLEFAHDIARSQGGETSEDNCYYKCIECHKGGDHHEKIVLDSKPQWSRKEGA